MEVTQEMLAAAMKNAVASGMLPKQVDEDTYLKNWAGMKVALRSALDAGPTGEMEQMKQDLAWHKQSLGRQTDKLSSVWSSIAELMQKTLGHECGDEPFDDLETLLLELKSARAALAKPETASSQTDRRCALSNPRLYLLRYRATS